VPIVLKYGSLNLLEPSGPVKACNGIAFYKEIVNARDELVARIMNSAALLKLERQDDFRELKMH
jgi:hypothetical protein